MLAGDEKWFAFGVTIAATLLIDAVYLLARPGLIPLKFLIPGTVFLIAFQVIPIIYMVNIAFTNYSTGHLFSKAEAITSIQRRRSAEPPNGKTYLMTPAEKGGDLVLILSDEETGKWFVGTKKALEPLASR